jgi:rhodanese-related sulfurtransferase
LKSGVVKWNILRQRRCLETIALTGLGALGWDVRGLKGNSFGGWVEAGYDVEAGLPPAPETMNTVELDKEITAAVAAMFTNVPDGYGVLTAETLNTELVENPDLIVIDVRWEEEIYGKGYIETSNYMHIPLEQFLTKKSMWPSDRDAPVAVYCAGGHRSMIAMAILWTYGFSDVRSLKGGFGGWSADGYPFITGEEASLDKAYGEFLVHMEGYYAIGLDALSELLVEDPPYLLDVRGLDETADSGHIPGSVTIPLRELGENISYLPEQDEHVVSYCGSGWRCTIALTGLGALGWDVDCLKGNSFSGWVEAGNAVEEGLPAIPETMNTVVFNETLFTVIDGMFSNVPDGYGVLKAENLNTSIVENSDLVLIDVRRDEEVTEKGVIDAPNVVHISLEQFINEKDMWPEDMSADIAIYCGSGHRSTIAMTILWSYGFESVTSLKGGFNGWVEAGYAVTEYVSP